ncbi:RING-H2 finger protein ATL1B, related [Eimeria acervulina]|uniref:RING-H2 finger protein ATL1B, related n=1 Tax=Eimeria acervulina TaxID=5801 RepID=U6GV26_EIMAC|nr:RING-H2 finger protein ATL1B, related [Eimeria acervulina]CDI83432.1 RING-H2 finger protein ATL1B, related [Eimeria acervulina]
MAAVFEYRARRMEADLRLLQNEDMIRRWGRVRVFSEYGIYIFRRGLTTDQIRRLPCQKLNYDPVEMMPCSICLEEFAQDEYVRVLQACGHIFHKSCIDIWLLRNAVCPNCKAPICASPCSTCCGLEEGGEVDSGAESCTTDASRRSPAAAAGDAHGAQQV